MSSMQGRTGRRFTPGRVLLPDKRAVYCKYYIITIRKDVVYGTEQ